MLFLRLVQYSQKQNIFVTDLQVKKSGTASKEVLTIRDEEKAKVGKNGQSGGGHAINSGHPTS